MATSDSLITLADGVRVKWVSGQGDDFSLHDSWTILATRAFGVHALLDKDRDTAWEAEACSDEALTFDLGSSRQVRALVLADHNLSATASVTLMAHTTDSWASPSFSQALSIASPNTTLFLDQTYRYWRLALADAANPAQVVSLGQVYLGDYFEPSHTFSVGYQHALVAGRTLVATDSGKVAGSARGTAQSYSLEFKRLTSSDLDGFTAMYQAVHPNSGPLSPMYFTPFSTEPQGTLYCLPGTSLNQVHVHQGRYSLSLSLEEVVRSHV